MSSDSGYSGPSVGYQEISRNVSFENLKYFECYLCKCPKLGKYDLTVHFKSHTGERQFKCDKAGCNKSFACKAYLNQHNRTHGKKVFNCDRTGCNKSFTSKAYLKQHDKRHSVERLFKCDQIDCNKSFKHKSDLTQHLIKKYYKHKWNQLMDSRQENQPKNDESNWNYLCVKCNKGFHKDTEMILHLKQDHGTSTCFCTICDMALEGENSRKEHVTKYHMQE